MTDQNRPDLAGAIAVAAAAMQADRDDPNVQAVVKAVASVLERQHNKETAKLHERNTELERLNAALTEADGDARHVLRQVSQTWRAETQVRSGYDRFQHVLLRVLRKLNEELTETFTADSPFLVGRNTLAAEVIDLIMELGVSLVGDGGNQRVVLEDRS